ncbi:VOC family protein [Streptosporangium sp. NPDC049644]|uniref:VOC family protein n=1 Tax=Streptosporangium sp. NPDC049644 TaxID=3155507 RepID=UPI00343BE76E
MTQQVPDGDKRLSRREISDAVGDLGWRYVLDVVRTSVAVASPARAVEVVARAVAVAGAEGERSLEMDVRPGRVVLTLRSPVTGAVTPVEVELAGRISAVVAELGLSTGTDVGGREVRSVQVLEIAIDAIDIAAVRPFWKAVMGYHDEPGASGGEGALVDPVGQGPAIWFQRMTAPRAQRNRIHLDVSVPHDEAPHRIEAALAAGGVLLSDASAPSFWVLADVEGNEACVTTWQGRD